MPSNSEDCCLYFVAVFISPVSVCIRDGCGIHFWLNLVLYIFTWILGVLHAFWLIWDTSNKANKQNLSNQYISSHPQQQWQGPPQPHQQHYPPPPPPPQHRSHQPQSFDQGNPGEYYQSSGGAVNHQAFEDIHQAPPPPPRANANEPPSYAEAYRKS